MQRAISGAGVLCSMDLLLARPLALPATRSATESSFGITNLCDLLSIPGSAASAGLFARDAMLSFHWYHRVGPLRTLHTLFPSWCHVAGPSADSLHHPRYDVCKRVANSK